MDIESEKRALRARFRGLIKSNPDRDSQSRALAERFLTSDAYAAAGTLALYRAFGGEVDLDLVAKRAEAEGRTVVFPRVVSAGGQPLQFAERGAGFVPGALGALEPSGKAVPLERIDCFVVPGLAFDRSGGRLGRGLGYYDATLGAAPKALRVALAFPFQLVERLPTTPSDQRMDLILTPEETATIRRARA